MNLGGNLGESHGQTCLQNGGQRLCAQHQIDLRAYPWKMNQRNHAMNRATILWWIPFLMAVKTNWFGNVYWRSIRHCRNVWAAR